MSSETVGTAGTKQGREVFSTRAAFLFAAIGSAVGLGNIWRFPYVAYDSGGGAFLIPYLVALLTAGIPLLFLDYALGHRYRGSAPKVFRRINRWAEPIGWIQVGVAFFITIYYAVIIAYAAMYAWKSIGKTWGDDPEGHFMNDFLQIDAAALCKMADRGQITGGLLDGPLAMDDAISPGAAEMKHIDSEVAGDADILVVPDFEAGNILYKDLTYLAGADAAGVVIGALAPIILASRADTVRTRVASASLAALVARNSPIAQVAPALIPTTS